MQYCLSKHFTSTFYIEKLKGRISKETELYLTQLVNLLDDYITRVYSKFNPDSLLMQLNKIYTQMPDPNIFLSLFDSPPESPAGLFKDYYQSERLDFDDILKFGLYSGTSLDITSILKSFFVKAIYTTLIEKFNQDDFIVYFGGDMIIKTENPDFLSLCNEYGEPLLLDYRSTKENIFSVVTSSNESSTRGKHIVHNGETSRNIEYITVITPSDRIITANMNSVNYIAGNPLFDPEEFLFINKKGEVLK